MKTMLLAAAAALSLGVGSAYAKDSYVSPDYQFSTQSAPSVATAPSGQAIQTHVASSNRGTWLFPPDQNGNG